MGGRGRRYREAFEVFCNDEYARILDAVACTVGDIDVAQDAVDEALARAWNRVRRGHDIESIAGWVRVVAINVVNDRYRHHSVEQKYLPALVPHLRDDSSHDTWGAAMDVRSALNALPSRQREVAVLYYVSDLSVQTIADELRISIGTVKSSLARARSALEQILTEAREEVPQ